MLTSQHKELLGSAYRVAVRCIKRGYKDRRKAIFSVTVTLKSWCSETYACTLTKKAFETEAESAASLREELVQLCSKGALVR